MRETETSFCSSSPATLLSCYALLEAQQIAINTRSWTFYGVGFYNHYMLHQYMDKENSSLKISWINTSTVVLSQLVQIRLTGVELQNISRALGYLLKFYGFHSGAQKLIIIFSSLEPWSRSNLQNMQLARCSKQGTRKVPDCSSPSAFSFLSITIKFHSEGINMLFGSAERCSIAPVLQH